MKKKKKDPRRFFLDARRKKDIKKHLTHAQLLPEKLLHGRPAEVDAHPDAAALGQVPAPLDAHRGPDRVPAEVDDRLLLDGGGPDEPAEERGGDPRVELGAPAGVREERAEPGGDAREACDDRRRLPRRLRELAHQGAAHLHHAPVGLVPFLPAPVGLESRELSVAEPAQSDEGDVGERVSVFVRRRRRRWCGSGRRREGASGRDDDVESRSAGAARWR
jgi:hypothetical protein